MKVEKRNGELVDYDVQKIHKILTWATEGIKNVSLSDIEMHAELNLEDGIKTKQIHRILKDSAIGLANANNPEYEQVAARLLLYSLRKDVWGESEPPRLLEHIKQTVKKQIYQPEILEWYTESEIHKLGKHIKHNRDEQLTHSGLTQLIDKYLLTNKITGEIYETPQFVYMLLAMCTFYRYPKKSRLKYVKSYYDKISQLKINLPTPEICGLRVDNQFASCILIDCDDTMDSYGASVLAVGKYTSKSAGIGLNLGRVRPVGSPVRSGRTIHTGVIPFLKTFESMVKSVSQSSRGGGATVNFPFWHLEAETIMKLKQNTEVDEKSVRKLDYVIQYSKIFYQRLLEQKKVTLFSPAECPDLYEAFGTPDFDELYEKYEKRTNISKKRIYAHELFGIHVKEYLETGRIYVMNIDHANMAGSWDYEQAKIVMTNLCTEILHPTIPISHPDDENGRIGVCLLLAINMPKIRDDKDFEECCDLCVRAKNEIIDIQAYPFIAAERFCKDYRSLGIGLTNLAGYLAKHKIMYDSQEALEVVDEFTEKLQYYLLKASCNLAKEKGEPCKDYHTTRYSKGELPIDWMNKEAKKLIKRKPSMDWKQLRKDIKEYGLYNCTLTSMMPCESSSVIQNATNGIEPLRELIVYKDSKSGNNKQIAPYYNTRKQYYKTAFQMGSNTPMLKMCATIQKWVDMGISCNLYYNYDDYKDGIIPLSVLSTDIVTAYSWGIKTLYYIVTPDGDDDATVCEGGACSI